MGGSIVVSEYVEDKRPTLFFSIFFNLYLFLRERDRVQAGEKQGKKETQNLKQAPGSELSAQNPTQGLNSQTLRS